MTSYIPRVQQGKRDFQPHSSKDICLAKSYPSRTVVHPKLEMTEPGDADEQEADAAAHDVMSGKVFRKFSGGGAGGGMAVSSQMESQLNQLQGGGQAMPDGLRSMMERGFDRDFSQVRLHTDGEAAGLSSCIHAKAFTHGNDIYFNQGQYAPETSEGQMLVAHELVHVAQGGGKVGRKAVFPRRPHLYEIKLLDAKGNTKTLNHKTEAIVSEERKSLVENDLRRALELVNLSIAYLEDAERDPEIYNRYFPQNNPRRLAYVLNTFKKIRNVILEKDIEFSYSHVKPYVDKDGRQYIPEAYVDEDKRYAIALSSFYFMSSDDDRACTIIHELAHEVNKYILDYRYGRKNAQSIAGRYRSTLNADNYNIFAKDVLDVVAQDILQNILLEMDDQQENKQGIESSPQLKSAPESLSQLKLDPELFSQLKLESESSGSLIKAPTNIYKPTFNLDFLKKLEGGRFLNLMGDNPSFQTGLWVKSYDNLGWAFLFPQNSSSLILSADLADLTNPGLAVKYTIPELFQLLFGMQSNLDYGVTASYTPRWFMLDSLSATLKGNESAIREATLTYGPFDFVKLQFSYINDEKGTGGGKLSDSGKTGGEDNKKIDVEKIVEDAKDIKVDQRFGGKTIFIEIDIKKVYEFIKREQSNP